MTKATRNSFWEGAGARGISLVIILICLASLGYIHRNDLFPPEAKKVETGLNPEFVKCRAARLGSVEKMRNDKIINASQYDTFKSRALAFCTSRFPPKGKKGPGNRPPGPPPGLPQR